MSMMVNISCDADGCSEYAETSVGMDDGANAIEGVLDEGWVHDGSSDYCPDHAGYAE